MTIIKNIILFIYLYSSIQASELETEEDYANILKLFFHKKELASNAMVEEHSPLILRAADRLGDIYALSNRPLSLVKAAALYQYCAHFTRKYHFDTPETYLQKACQLDGPEAYLQTIVLKQQLNVFRKEIKEKVGLIQQSSAQPSLIHAQEIESIYSLCREFFTGPSGFITLLFEEAKLQIPSFNNETSYTLFGLGSMQWGNQTPWSDFEFGILIDDPAQKPYFEAITEKMLLKIVNLGETLVSYIGIECLNNFRSTDPDSDWFWDTVSSVGFTFDGFKINACKTPLGRKNYPKFPDYSLIGTPKDFIDYITNPQWYKDEPHLVQELCNISMICGDQILMDRFQQSLNQIWEPRVMQYWALETLKCDLSRFSLKMIRGIYHDDLKTTVYLLKWDFYRIVDRLIAALTQFYGLKSSPGEPILSAFQAIQRLQERGHLSLDGAHHFQEILALVKELRLITYSYYDRQREEIVITEDTVKPISFFMFSDKYVQRLKSTVLRLEHLAEDFTDGILRTYSERQFQLDPLYLENSNEFYLEFPNKDLRRRVYDYLHLFLKDQLNDSLYQTILEAFFLMSKKDRDSFFLIITQYVLWSQQQQFTSTELLLQRPRHDRGKTLRLCYPFFETLPTYEHCKLFFHIMGTQLEDQRLKDHALVESLQQIPWQKYQRGDLIILNIHDVVMAPLKQKIMMNRNAEKRQLFMDAIRQLKGEATVTHVWEQTHYNLIEGNALIEIFTSLHERDVFTMGISAQRLGRPRAQMIPVEEVLQQQMAGLEVTFHAPPSDGLYNLPLDSLDVNNIERAELNKINFDNRAKSHQMKIVSGILITGNNLKSDCLMRVLTQSSQWRRVIFIDKSEPPLSDLRSQIHNYNLRSRSSIQVDTYIYKNPILEQDLDNRIVTHQLNCLLQSTAFFPTDEESMSALTPLN